MVLALKTWTVERAREAVYREMPERKPLVTVQPRSSTSPVIEGVMEGGWGLSSCRRDWWAPGRSYWSKCNLVTMKTPALGDTNVVGQLPRTPWSAEWNQREVMKITMCCSKSFAAQKTMGVRSLPLNCILLDVLFLFDLKVMMSWISLPWNKNVYSLFLVLQGPTDERLRLWKGLQSFRDIWGVLERSTFERL